MTGHVTRAAVVAEARTWKGVGVMHRGRTRAGGVDCLGLVMGAGIATGAVDDPGEASAWWKDYGRLPNPRHMRRALDESLVPIERAAMQPGDVVGFDWGVRGLLMHLAILADFKGRLMIIHAYPLTRPKRVVEVGYSADWPERYCAAWSFPN